MMTWTLYILLVTADGQWQALEGRTFSKPGACQRVAEGLKGRPVSNAVVYHAICKETINT